jgi:putative flippase GtrA
MENNNDSNIINKTKDTFLTKDFLNYTGVSIFISVLNIILLWLMIDILNIPTIISTTLVIGGTFVLRYFLYRFKNII